MDPFKNDSCYGHDTLEDFSVYKRFKGSKYSVQVCQFMIWYSLGTRDFLSPERERSHGFQGKQRGGGVSGCQTEEY